MEVLAKKEHRIILENSGLSKLDKRKRSKNNHLVRFSLYQTEESVLFFISSSLLDGDNFKAMLQGRHFSLLISEANEIEKPFHVHNIDKNALDGEVDEKLKAFNYSLPDDDFRLKQISWNKDRNRVEVQLQHTYKNWNNIINN